MEDISMLQDKNYNVNIKLEDVAQEEVSRDVTPEIVSVIKVKCEEDDSHLTSFNQHSVTDGSTSQLFSETKEIVPIQFVEPRPVMCGVGTIRSFDSCSVSCRRIRIGSYTVNCITNVVISLDGVFLEFTELLKGKHKILQIPMDDIVHCEGFLGIYMPILFVYTTPGFGRVVRNMFNMTSKDDSYYDPESTDETLKRITLSIMLITKEHKNCILSIFNEVSTVRNSITSILVSVTRNMANSILVNSTTRANVNEQPPAKQMKLGSCVIPCMCVNVGSHKANGLTKIAITAKHISVEVKLLQELRYTRLIIPMTEILRCEVNLESTFPIMFLNTTASYCQQVRQRLNMNKHGPYFDCESLYEQEKRIILFIERISETNMKCIEDIFNHLTISRNSTPVLVSVERNTAQKMMVHSLYDEPQRAVTVQLNKNLLVPAVPCSDDYILTCRGIRIGSYRVNRELNVVISADRITLDVRMPSEETPFRMQLPMDDIESCVACLSNHMPVLFLTTNPACSEELRIKLNMTSLDGPYYDPTSSEESHKRITLIIARINDAQRFHIQTIFRKLSEIRNCAAPVFNEVGFDTANEILVNSIPVKIEKKYNKT